MSEFDDDARSFVPQLDARQRAMLAEMGVRVWAPKADAVPTARPDHASDSAPPSAANPEPVVAVAPAPVSPPVAKTAAVPVAPPVAPAPVVPAAAVPAAATPASQERLRPAGVAQMDWPALQAAVAGCEACGLCKTR
ncbi:MAG: hypothetical protein KDF54_06415, partial [Hydrogenophaga sp.]|nr:hypothetical protein [Hydrogenophaga sp.]